MRYHLLADDGEEFIVSLKRTIVHSSELVEFQFCAVSDDTNEKIQNIFVRSLARQYFVSNDGIQWSKLARQDLPDSILNVNKVFRLFRGFKPSGIAKVSEGNLVTQMPGKVVKILVGPGAKVTKGQTLVILEAMKMENEIKSSVEGVISAIHIKEGQALEYGFLMMEVDKA